MPGPLHGLKVVEIAAIGPAPFCGMLLADMGAEVVRVDRKGERHRASAGDADVLQRGRRSITLDLKRPSAVDIVLQLVERSDVLIEGFRPGVMERLGLGPDICLARQPKLVYGRMSGWGQSGPLAQAAGHDINYLALSGALHALGDADRPPTPPLNLVSDFGAGGMMLAFGLICAAWEAIRSGGGQVVDAAMSDGSALLMAMLYGYVAMDRWDAQHRGVNFLDGSAPFYGVYRCADGRFLAVGSIEPQFYARLLAVCGVSTDQEFQAQWDTTRWPRLKGKLGDVFLQRTRDEWVQAFAHEDACVSPVLDMSEAPAHPHHVARQSFVNSDGLIQPAPAPRFLRTPADIPAKPTPQGAQSDEVLASLGLDAKRIQALRAEGVVA